MRKFDLFQGAIISVENKQGQRRVWVHQGDRRFPLVNWEDLQEGIAQGVLNVSFEFAPCLEGPLHSSTN